VVFGGLGHLYALSFDAGSSVTMVEDDDKLVSDFTYALIHMPQANTSHDWASHQQLLVSL